MLTPLYTPPIRTIANIPRRPKPREDAIDDATSAPFREQIQEGPESTHPSRATRATSDNGDGQRRQQQEGTLGSLQEQQTRGSISIQTILGDFQKTLESINATKNVKDDVTPYLQVIAHQARQKNPSVSLIRQNLSIAAGTIDSFIAQSLGQPSNVVKEWVDALLMQPINYNLSASGKALATAETISPAMKTSSLDEATRQAIIASLQAGREALKTQDWDNAREHFESAQVQLGDNSDEPLWQAQTLTGFARIAHHNNQTEEAIKHLKQALTWLKPIEPHKMQARLLTQLASLQRASGNTEESIASLDTAEGLYQQLEEPELALKVRHRRAKLYLDTQQPQQAQALLADTLENAGRLPLSLQMGTWELLGRAQQTQGLYKDAFQSLRIALESAQKEQDTPAFKRIAQHLASLYLETGKPEKAVSLLQKAL
jgi:tetratricopeptide (TPR) repeat protein